MNITRLILLISILALGGCTTSQREQIEQAKVNQAKDDLEKVSDPFEGFNRAMWTLNRDVLDRFLLKPLTQAYVAVTPQILRTGLLNAAENLQEPANTINNLLQGKPSDSFASFSRFAINSTVGIFGIIDVADKMGIERKDENFAQVLGAYGVDSGPYLMVPVLGPNDIRGFVGDFADRYYWPETVMEDPHTIAATAIRIIETRALLLEQEDLIERSLDPYLFVRDIYFQRSAFNLSDGKIEQQSEEELQEEADEFADFEALLEGTE